MASENNMDLCKQNYFIIYVKMSMYNTYMHKKKTRKKFTNIVKDLSLKNLAKF